MQRWRDAEMERCRDAERVNWGFIDDHKEQIDRDAR
jgi:hypothetical protein